MDEQFNIWNEVKKGIQNMEPVSIKAGEVGWASLGFNIGTEVNGSNDNFERPVLIIRYLNKETVLALPITSTRKYLPLYVPIHIDGKEYYVSLAQVRVLSTRRISRMRGQISNKEPTKVIEHFKDFI